MIHRTLGEWVGGILFQSIAQLLAFYRAEAILTHIMLQFVYRRILIDHFIIEILLSYILF